MALLDGLLGGNNGGDSTNVNSNSDTSSFDILTNPGLGFAVSDVLHSENSSVDGGDGDSDHSSFTGIGDLGLILSAPTGISFDQSSSSHSASQQEGNNDDGGLLGGLL